MRVDDLVVRYDYGYWANRKLFDVVAQLPADQFTQSVTGGWGSIRTTMVHALSAEWGWTSRCGGRPERPARLDPADYPTAESLIHEWERVEGYVRAFLSTLTDDDLSRHVDYSFEAGQDRSLPLGQLMQHAAAHGVHHRGQVALMLRLLGYTPGNIDLLFYYAEKRRQQ